MSVNLTKHEKAINKLIPEAMDEAIRMTVKKSEGRIGTNGTSSYTHSFESEAFHKIMNRLTFEAGLRSYQ